LFSWEELVDVLDPERFRQNSPGREMRLAISGLNASDGARRHASRVRQLPLGESCGSAINGQRLGASGVLPNLRQ
jgi:hypothetical protein